MKKKLFISLKFKITLTIAILLGLFSSFIYFYFSYKIEDEKLLNFQEKADIIVNLTSNTLSSFQISNNELELEEDIGSLFSNKSIKYVVLSSNDSVYYGYNKDFANLVNYFDLNNEKKSANLEILKRNIQIINNEKMFELFIGFSTEQVIDEISEQRSKLGIISLAIFFIGMVLAFVIGSFFTTPLKKMMNSVNEIKDGKSSQLLEIKSSDEFGFLADSFNKMIINIESSKVEMDKINRELEKRVKDRTREVEGALRSLQNENKQRKAAEIEISNSLHEKEVLLKEIHHRVKNNLQIVSSLLFFQSQQISDPKTLDMFRDGQNRVKSMALIHEKLYQSGDLANIDFKQYVKKLTNFLFQSYGVNQTKIKLRNNVQGVELGVDSAVPFGLIINEIISNSLKHGFKNQETGEIKIDMGYDENNKLILIISDNGVGISEDLKIEESESLGLRLVNNLTTQLNGTVTFMNNKGTTVKIVIQNPNSSRMS